MAAAFLLGSVISFGQEADADRAKALLAQGVAQFNALQFRAAKATLSQVNREDLASADKRTLDEYLNTKLDPAIKAQMAATAAYKDAEKAVEAGEFQKARDGFKAASASEYLPAATRQDAEAQLAVVEQKLAAAKTAPQIAAVKTPTTEPTSKPAEAAEPPVPATSPAEPVTATTTTMPALTAQTAEAELPVVTAQTAEAELPAVAKPVPTTQEAPSKVLQDVQGRQLKVEELLVNGQEALDQNQADRAVGYFERALALSPENEQARKQLDYARGMVTTVGEAGIISRMERRRLIAKQAADVEFEKTIKHSQELLAAADSGAAFDSAEAAARSGGNVLDTYKDLYTEREYQQKQVEVDNQLKLVGMKRDQWAQTTVRRQAEEVLQRDTDRQRREEEDRRTKILQLTNRAKSLRSEGKYDQSLEVSKEVLSLDPKDPWAAEQVDVLEQFILTQQQYENQQSQRYHEQKQMTDIREAEIPWWELIKYPRDWKELTVRRGPYAAGRGGESREDRDMRMKLQQVQPKLEFTAEEFEGAIDYLRTTSGLNIYVKWDALQLEGIDRTKEVNLRLTNVTTEKALRVILDDVGGVVPLSYVIDEGVITVSTKSDLSTRTYTKAYDIRDLIVRVPNFEAPEAALTGTISGANAGGNAGGGFGGGNNASGGNNNQNVPTRQELVDNIITLVTTTIDPQSWSPVGTLGLPRELNGQLVVTQTADNHKKIMDLIDQLREARLLLVSIEARFISVNTGFLNSIGVDLDFFFNLGSPLGSTHVVDPFTGATVPTSGGSSGWGPGHAGNEYWTPMAVHQGSTGFTDMVGVGSGIGSQVSTPSMSLAGTFLDDVQVNFLIEATQAHQATRTLNAPRLTLFNGQQAYVLVGTQQSYVADLDPVVAENAVAFNPIMGVVGSGTSLEVEAVVSADRRYVTLTVTPSVSQIIGFDKYAVIATSTDAAGNPITGEGFIQLPKLSSQLLQTTVSVPDGGTLLLGGQRLSTEIEREMGVPLLNKIPVLNRAFANRGMVRDEQTLLILIKPKIIIQTEEEGLQFPS